MNKPNKKVARCPSLMPGMRNYSKNWLRQIP